MQRRLALSVRCVVLGGSRSLRVVVGAFLMEAVAVARQSWHHCLRRHAGAPGTGSVGQPHSLRRDARSLLFCEGGSLSRRGAWCLVAHTRRVWSWTPSSLGRSPSRGARGAPACGATLALLPPAWSYRRARGGLTLGRRPSATVARFLGAVRRARRLALSACGRRRGRFHSGDGRRCAALAGPLPAAPRWRSWRRVGRAATLTAA